MPNAFAILVLGLWPFATLGLFRLLPPARALIVSLFVAYLFLPPPPTQFDLPLIPALTKTNLPSIAALAACFLFYRDRLRLIPESNLAKVFLAIFIFSPVLTALTNMSPVIQGLIGLPPLGIKDAISMVMQQGILVLPMLLARSFLTQDVDQRDLLLAFMGFGLIYSLPMLVEVRLSPQMNVWIYGYFQHSFDQMMRYGGFRPIVFLYHGLWAAFFILMSICAAATLTRAETGSRRIMMLGATFYLAGILVLCKSAGSLIYAMALLPMILLLGQSLKIKLAFSMALLAISYPVLKSAGLVPETQLLDLAARFSEDRAGSLGFRFDNENQLLARALERPLFGWGSWGRNLILDPISGQILSVTDGRWIIVLGVFGWAGFASEIGLLALPVVLAWHKLRTNDKADWSPYVAGLCLMLGINLVDLLPNATLTPLTWLIAGALLGYAERTTLEPRTAFKTTKAPALRSVM